MLAGFVAINSGSTGNRCSHNLQTMPGKEIMNFVKTSYFKLSKASFCTCTDLYILSCNSEGNGQKFK